MVIYCRVEQPGLNCTLKLLTILMPPNHPKVYLFPTRRVWDSPLLTVSCGRIQSLEKTCRRTSSAGFQGRLLPQLLIAVGLYEHLVLLNKPSLHGLGQHGFTSCTE